MESILERQAWSEFEEESGDDDDVGLENIVDETLEDHVEELMEILGRRWSYFDYPTTVIESTHRLATGALSVEQAVDLELAHLEAPGDLADQLAHVIADYFRMLIREWLGFAHSEDGGDRDGDGDEILSQFSTRHYNNDDVDDDGEEETDNCCVCLERLHCGLVATLHCRHEFHRGCIGSWLRRGHNFCPLCKARALR